MKDQISWTYVFVNLGLGDNVTDFNITLTGNAFWNETGNGTFCLPKYPLPSDLNITDGADATIQFVTVGSEGSALYNVSADSTEKADLMIDSPRSVRI